jgi:hypothetical protein
MRDRRSPNPVAAALGLAACGLASLVLPACSARNHIQPGSYTASRPPGASARGVQLAIAADKSHVTFTPPGAPALERSASAWDPSRWPMLCPRGLKDTSSEVLDLGPEPLQLGATRVEHPLLVANCGGKPIVDLRALGSDGRPTQPAVVEFER